MYTHLPLQRATNEVLMTRLSKNEIIRDIRICLCTCHAYVCQHCRHVHFCLCYCTVSVRLCACITYTVLTTTTSCTKEMKNSDHSKFLVSVKRPSPPPSPPSPHHRTLPPPSPPSPPPSPAFSTRTSSAGMFGPGGWPVTGRAKSGRIVLNARTCPHGSK